LFITDSSLCGPDAKCARKGAANSKRLATKSRRADEARRIALKYSQAAGISYSLEVLFLDGTVFRHAVPQTINSKVKSELWVTPMRCLKWDCYLVSLRSHSSSGPDMPFASEDVCATAVTITMTETQDATPRAIRRGGSRPISPTCRSFCGSRNQISGIDSSARRFPPPRCLADNPVICADIYSTQSRFCLTAPSVLSTLHSFFCAAPQPTIQVCNLLRGVNDGRNSVPLFA
jgi:hypothetical protein